MQTSSCALVTVFTHAQLYCPICECEVMVLCTGVEDAVNQATQCISTLKALSTRLLLRCFLGAANWLLCGCHQPVSPGSQRNLQHCGLRRDRFCVACRIQPSGSLLFGRSQSLCKTTCIIADFIQKIAARSTSGIMHFAPVWQHRVVQSTEPWSSWLFHP